MTDSRKKGGARPGAGRPRVGASVVIRLPLPVATIARRVKDGSLRAGDVNAFLDVAGQTVATVPLVGSTAACGFPSPADDYMDRPLDFNDLLVKNPAATFAVRVAGESMTGRGMFPGDIAVIDRARQPVSGCIVLALLAGEFTIKTYRKRAQAIVLEPANPAFPEIVITEEAAFEVWGVVTGCIHLY